MSQEFLSRRSVDEERIETSRLLTTIVWILLSASLLMLIGLVALPQLSTRWWSMVLSVYGVSIPVLVLNRLGYTRLASGFLMVGWWAILTGAALTAGGIGSFGPLFYLTLVFIAGLLLGSRAAIVSALICILTGLGLVVLELSGRMQSTAIPHTPFTSWIAITMLIIMMMSLQYLSLRRVHDALSRSRRELDERTRTESELRRVSERLQLATRAASIGIWDWDVVNDKLVWDDAMYSLFGVRKDGFSGAYDAWERSLAPEDFERARAEVQAALRGQREFASEFRIVWPDGSVHFIKADSQTFRDEAGRAVRMIGVNYDITKRKLAEERVNLLQTITLDVAAAYDLSSALEVVLRRVCEKTGWALGQAWVPRQDGTGLDCCPASFTIATKLDEFRAQSRKISLPAGKGLPGRVWASGQPVWIRDVTQDMNFPRAEAAVKAGLKAALAVPILSGNKVIAVLEFFLSEPREEDERLVEVIAAVATQISLVIERKQAEEENRMLIKRLGERVKELTALHRTAQILQDKSNSVPNFLEEIVGLIPAAWQYPEVTAARITFGSIECASPNFVRTQWSQRTEFTAGNMQGALEVVYLQERPEEDIGPFLLEERNLIDSLAEMITSALNHEYAQEALRESERRLSDTLTNIEMIAVMADMKGDITFCNDHLLRLTGWNREEAIGRNWFEMFLPEDEKEKVSELLNGVDPSGEVTIYLENAIKTRSGERRLVKWTNTTLRGLDGKVIGVAALGDDITERKAAEDQLKASSEQLRALSERLRRAKEEEGKRIARELHDELGSGLTSLKWSLLGLEKLYSEVQNLSVHERVIPQLKQMVELVDDTINSVRRISSELRPGILDDLGVVAAIEWQTLQFHGHSGIVCEFESLADDVAVDREQGTVLFRIFQEAMTNVLRHATATKVNVIFEEENGEFLLEVSDNGRGITEIETRGALSLGLLGMRERANSVGGIVEIKGAAGKGTRVIVRLPIKPQAQTADVG